MIEEGGVCGEIGLSVIQFYLISIRNRMRKHQPGIVHIQIIKSERYRIIGKTDFFRKKSLHSVFSSYKNSSILAFEHATATPERSIHESVAAVVIHTDVLIHIQHRQSRPGADRNHILRNHGHIAHEIIVQSRCFIGKVFNLLSTDPHHSEAGSSYNDAAVAIRNNACTFARPQLRISFRKGLQSLLTHRISEQTVRSYPKDIRIVLIKAKTINNPLYSGHFPADRGFLLRIEEPYPVVSTYKKLPPVPGYTPD